MQNKIVQPKIKLISKLRNAFTKKQLKSVTNSYKSMNTNTKPKFKWQKQSLKPDLIKSG